MPLVRAAPFPYPHRPASNPARSRRRPEWQRRYAQRRNRPERRIRDVRLVERSELARRPRGGARLLRDRRRLVRAPAVREDVGRRGRHRDPGPGRPAEPGDLPHAARRKRALRDRARDAGAATRQPTRFSAASCSAWSSRSGSRPRSPCTAQFESRAEAMVWGAINDGTTWWATSSPRSRRDLAVSDAGKRAGRARPAVAVLR